MRFTTVHNKFASLSGWFRRLRHDKQLQRFVAFSLAANVVGYSLVFVLTSRGVMGTWMANESVSKAMAPTGLFLNTLALTGRLKPTLGQATKWTAWWVPSAFIGAICMGLVVAKFGLGSLESRAVAGVMMFPFDYGVKRFFIFAKHRSLANFILKQKFALIIVGVVIWVRVGQLRVQMTETV